MGNASCVKTMVTRADLSDARCVSNPLGALGCASHLVNGFNFNPSNHKLFLGDIPYIYIYTHMLYVLYNDSYIYIFSICIHIYVYIHTYKLHIYNTYCIHIYIYTPVDITQWDAAPSPMIWSRGNVRQVMGPLATCWLPVKVLGIHHWSHNSYWVPKQWWPMHPHIQSYSGIFSLNRPFTGSRFPIDKMI